jgi:2-polyprenyl-6-methoxyphenol hydroxylase-like FAD-dependent oxidoreductase
VFDGVYDAVVVGFGPTGAGMTALLGRLGHRVIAVERHTTRYHLARTGKLDAEVMRIYQSLGCADRVLDQTLPVVSRHYLNADGVELASFRINANTPSGWHEYLMCWQPDVEDIVAETTEGFPRVEVLRGWDVTHLQERGDVVEVDMSRSERDAESTRRRADETVRLRTRFVIGADGANSVVREKAGIELEDFGVRWDWLVVDTRPTQEMPHVLARVGDRAIPYGPFVYQVFDPSRPRKTMPLGRDHLRFEFALLSPEELARSSDPAFGYELLAECGGDRSSGRVPVPGQARVVLPVWTHVHRRRCGASHAAIPGIGDGDRVTGRVQSVMETQPRTAWQDRARPSRHI